MMRKPEAGSPSEAAFEQLRRRVEADSSLDVEVREAVLTDLTSDKPSAFAALRAFLDHKGRTDGALNEDESPERSGPTS